ncbi:MAG TPA: hypothetical protein QF604_18270 [Candidatus Latescibacteria bacterium]|jgi:hypothetical protein|nr:hypothetical protein [Gemmatimonadota bacterium]MDP7364418.1 hypothetical protein [Candidatus Latescibacterota bacterium]MDP7634023.1 hypothetical protein [Candidatus Latescibacterota bacterium]HJN29855.1 hypothetical protein [Candidatus Latescibacterota bacterium]|tara:strand:- start:1209 stop:1577 length:369 start_codon:yes stop_codon:yes gene_type:complete
MPIRKSLFLFAFAVTAVAQAENQPPIVLIHDATHELGSGTFVETEAETSTTYLWSVPASDVSNTLNYVPIDRMQPAEYYLYLVADDGVNEPVLAITPSAVAVGTLATAVEDQGWAGIKSQSR